MLCGTRSFSDIDDDRRARASSPRPKLSKLKQSLSLDRGRKQAASNPYSNEGLEKFERLMAELEAKKEEVLLRKKRGDDSSTIVRFKYNSDTGDWVPIIVSLQPKEKPIPPAEEEEEEKGVAIKQVAGEKSAAEMKKKKKKSKYSWIVIDVQHVWAVVIGLVLLSCCFVMIGRAFVVCSATILWYMVPMMDSGSKWDLKVYGKRLIGRNYLGVAPPSSSSSSSSSSSVNVKKMGSDHVILVSKRQ